MKGSDYKIIQAHSLESLEKLVVSFVSDGYLPSGGIIQNGSRWAQVIYYVVTEKSRVPSAFQLSRETPEQKRQMLELEKREAERFLVEVPEGEDLERHSWMGRIDKLDGLIAAIDRQEAQFLAFREANTFSRK